MAPKTLTKDVAEVSLWGIDPHLNDPETFAGLFGYHTPRIGGPILPASRAPLGESRGLFKRCVALEVHEPGDIVTAGILEDGFRIGGRDGSQREALGIEVLWRLRFSHVPCGGLPALAETKSYRVAERRRSPPLS